ncbi:hypothetical protein AWE51_11690 [Aquimarina aggregata]|uniref:Uncharacterized protein n=1 Tax=Aquimarina aggregata TaxID=1642818 RepID=A0A162YLG0_9FLAO|nr:hypothetical protein [Aquimarina aggregata]KZS39210.1 hypothetical protein AWE51_11690 [Aquimarina aggregata]
MNDSPIWYEQIAFQKKNKYITNGLTIPYLIGIYKLLNHTLENPIKSLLNKIIESDFDKCAVLQKCPQIGHYVVGIDNREFCERFMKKDIQFRNSKGNTSLFITLNANNLGDNVEKIIKEFENLYSELIQNDQHSWNNKLKKWEEFGQSEIERINKV